MNFKQMTYFIAVAEELHFGRAAERLDMAQPPLSRQIKQIEEELEAVLFNRGRSAISLTQAGEKLLERSRAILALLDDTKLEMRRLGQGAEGRLRIGFVGSSTYGILPNIVKAFRAAYPSINLSLQPMNNAQLRKQLVARMIDVAVARPALDDAEFAVKHLVKEDLILALPSYADTVINACTEAGFPVPKRVFTMDLQTALSLVAIGEGVCVVPSSVGSAPRNGIKFLRIEPEIARTSLSVNYRVDEQGVHVQNFIKVAQSVAREAR